MQLDFVGIPVAQVGRCQDWALKRYCRYPRRSDPCETGTNKRTGLSERDTGKAARKNDGFGSRILSGRDTGKAARKNDGFGSRILSGRDIGKSRPQERRIRFANPERKGYRQSRPQERRIRFANPERKGYRQSRPQERWIRFANPDRRGYREIRASKKFAFEKYGKNRYREKVEIKPRLANEDEVRFSDEGGEAS